MRQLNKTAPGETSHMESLEQAGSAGRLPSPTELFCHLSAAAPSVPGIPGKWHRT